MTSIVKMVDADPERPFDIQSRIKLFSSNTDNNANITKKKPVPRQRSDPKLSPCLDKPSTPTKPFATPRVPKPMNNLTESKGVNINKPVSPKPISKITKTDKEIVNKSFSPKADNNLVEPVNRNINRPVSPKPKPKPKPLLENHTNIKQDKSPPFRDIASSESNNMESVSKNIENRTLLNKAEKPKPPEKPSSLNISPNTSTKKLNDIKSPIKSPQVDLRNNPRKPPRITQRTSQISVYENQEIKSNDSYEYDDFASHNIIKNQVSLPSRCDTLDGVMVLNNPVKVSSPCTDISKKSSPSSCRKRLSAPLINTNNSSTPTSLSFKNRSSSEEAEEDYNYVYEHHLQRTKPALKPNLYEDTSPKKGLPNLPNTKNNAVEDDYEEDAMYDDPETIDFKPNLKTNDQPKRNLSSVEAGKDEDDDEDTLYEDPETIDFTPNLKINHQPTKSLASEDTGKVDDDEDTMYEDPETIDFTPNLKISPQHKRSLSSEDENEYDLPPEEDYEEPPEDARYPSNNGGHTIDSDDDNNDMYEDPDTIDFHPTFKIKQQNQSDDEDAIYDKPPEDDRYPLIHKDDHDGNELGSSSDDDEHYEMPDDFKPPPISKDAKPPPVPNHAQNNLQSSSDDEEVVPSDYMDPELDLCKPPVPVLSPGRRMTVRKGSILSPTEYMPDIGKLIPSLKEENDMNYDSLYHDPDLAFDYQKLSDRKINEEEDEIYSDEPLYQAYTQEKNEESHNISKKKDSTSRSYEDVDYAYKEGSLRLLWSQLPSVQEGGFLTSLSDKERKRQEAMFEVITSEASYLKSLDILVDHFMLNPKLLPNPNMPSENEDEVQMIDRQQYHFLFSGISAVKAVSERFLKDLRKRQQDSIKISTISDIITDHAKNHFQCYVKYCSNQVFQDRTLQSLMYAADQTFLNLLLKLEADPICQNLKMQSFLTLPMQRITRLPLLVDAITNHCEPGSEEEKATNRALRAVNKLVHDSNEGARKMERTEEMYYIQKTLTFKTKPIPLISSSRWLVKKGDIMCLHEEGKFSKYRNQLRHLFKGSYKRIYLFLFTDLLLVTKMKNDEVFKVIDYCQRSLLKVEIMSHVPDPEPPKVGTLGTLNLNPPRYAFSLVLLENAYGKTVDYHCFLSTETDKTRWMEAFNPTVAPSVEGESIYEEWDCPQNQVLYSYQAEQADELTLIAGDIIHVLRKLPDGWAEGVRMRDNERGWFPINHTDEIDSRHTRARNLMQRYRLNVTCQMVVNEILGK